MTPDARREAVAEIVHAALDFNMLVNTILAWHDAETRALREALQALVAASAVSQTNANQVGIGKEWAAARALLTPTPGAGKP